MNLRNILLFALSGLLIAGCGDSPQKRRSDQARPGETATNLNEVVFAIVNGVKLTAAEVRDSVLVLERVQTLAKRPPNEKYRSVWRNVTAMKAVPQLISGMLVVQEAERRKLAASDASKKRILSRYQRLTGEKEIDLGRIAAHFGEERDAFCRQFERESLFDTFFEQEGARRWTEKDVDLFLSDATNRVRTAERINNRARAQANAAWEALNAGRSWKDVVAEFNDEDPDDDEARGFAEEWESFRLKDFFLPEVSEALVGKKVGEYTKPVECEAGMVIARVVKIENEVYTCARLLMRMSVNMQIPSRERARLFVARQKRIEVQKKLLGELRAKAELQFPLGTNFTYHIWSGGVAGKLNGLDVRRVNGPTK